MMIVKQISIALVLLVAGCDLVDEILAACAKETGARAVGFLPALNAFTMLLAYRMQYAEEVGTLSSAGTESGLLGRGPLDWEGSVR